MPTQELVVRTKGRGLHEITAEVCAVVRAAGAHTGLCCVFIAHTSASLLIQENADPSARRDLEAWLDRHVPDADPLHTHASEGPDDMPSHIRAALTATSLVIPVVNGAPALGTWQGVYLWEHRLAPHTRRVIVTVLADR